MDPSDRANLTDVASTCDATCYTLTNFNFEDLADGINLDASHRPWDQLREILD